MFIANKTKAKGSPDGATKMWVETLLSETLSENAVKSQIFVVLIVYLMLVLIRRVYCKGKTAFSNFCEIIRFCLLHYLSVEYIYSINGKVHKVELPPWKTLFDRDKFPTQTDLFNVYC